MKRNISILVLLFTLIAVVVSSCSSQERPSVEVIYKYDIDDVVCFSADKKLAAIIIKKSYNRYNNDIVIKYYVRWFNRDKEAESRWFTEPEFCDCNDDDY
jgi:hypothetical protein